MITTLHLFQERIKKLLSFLDDAEAVNELAYTDISLYPDSREIQDLQSRLRHLRDNKVDRRTQTYASSMIMLYALFEQYVEEVLMAYLDELAFIAKRPSDIPEAVRKKHIAFSAQLLINGNLDKYRDRYRESEVIQRMHLFASGESFQVNTLAFIDHRSNFRHESLNEFFTVVGISHFLSQIKQTLAFKKYSEEQFPNQKVTRLEDKIVFDELDDLAWRRNVVGHGWPDKDNLLSIKMMRERADFIRVLGESIYEVLRQNVLPYIVKYHGCALPRPLVVHRNVIVCFHLETDTISEGAYIVAKNANDRYFEGRVESIEVNHVRQEQVEAPPAVDVGCCVTFRAKENYEYFLIDE